MNTEIQELGKVSVTVDEDDWNQGKAYEKLTIVSDPSVFKAFISLRDVPPGIPNTDKRFWLCFAQLDEKIVLDYLSFKLAMEKQFKEFTDSLTDDYNSILRDYKNLKNEMDSFLHNSGSGVAFAEDLGTSDVIGVSQKGLSQIINDIYDTLADMQGTNERGFSITVTPSIVLAYNTAEAKIKIYASGKKFDYIKIYLDDELVAEDEDVTVAEYTANVSQTTEVKVVGSVLGVEYIKHKTINVAYPFFVGCGTVYTDIINTDNIQPYEGTLQGHYTIKPKQNDKIFVVIPTSIDNTVDHIQMGGFDIPFNKSTDGDYTIYTSINEYIAGEYVIDIN